MSTTQIKHKLAVLFLVGLITQPTWAGNPYQDDMAFAFGNTAVSGDVGDMALLSDQEMMATEGHFGFFGALGGLSIGLWTYGGHLVGGGAHSWSNALATIGGSTLGGAVGGPMAPLVRYSLSRMGAGLGLTTGWMNSHGW